jgi:hypothetical protein
MSTTKSRPSYKTEKVVYDDGKVVNIMRCAAEDMDKLMDLQDKLVERYVMADGAIGKYFTSEYRDDLEADLRAICSIIPLVEKTKSGETQYLDYDLIKENWEQLISLFFNGDINEESRNLTSMSPCKISQLHFLPYMEMWNKYLAILKEEKEKEKENR